MLCKSDESIFSLTFKSSSSKELQLKYRKYEGQTAPFTAEIDFINIT